jgi:hypothetical protein
VSIQISKSITSFTKGNSKILLVSFDTNQYMLAPPLYVVALAFYISELLYVLCSERRETQTEKVVEIHVHSTSL